jgi:simple sugar transport system permease protein
VFVFGTEGVMLIGALAGFMGAIVSHNIFVGVLLGLIAGIGMGLLTAFYAVTLSADQVIFAIALLVLGPSLTDYIYGSYISHGAISPLSMEVQTFNSIPIPYLSKIPVLGAFFNQNAFVYTAYVLLISSQYFLYHTKWGLKIRAVGMNPRAADSMGSNVYLVRYLSVIVGAVMAAMGGVALILAGTGFWVDNVSAGRGFIGVALVRVGNWKMGMTYVAALIVSLLLAAASDLSQAYSSASGQSGTTFPYEIFSALPYIFAIVVIAISYKWTRSNQPAALGVAYKRE